MFIYAMLSFILQEPSMAKNSSPSRTPKNGAQLHGGARKMPHFTAKKKHQPPSRHEHRHTARRIMSRFPVRTCGCRPSRTKYEILPKARKLTHEVSARYKLEEIIQFSKCELPWHSTEAASGSDSTFHVEDREIRP